MALQLSLAAKRWTVLVILVALLVWPTIHFGLVTEHRLSPWKFLGFAMYCKPSLPVVVNAYVLRDGVPEPFPISSWPGAGRQRLAQFKTNREILGTLAVPNNVAAWILRARPDIHEFVLEVRHRQLDASTNYIVEETFPYRYVRPGTKRR